MTRLSSHSDDLLRLTYYRGRVALYAILKGLGVGRGDDVLTQAFTCLAVPEGIRATGASPVFVDIQSGGVNLDAEDLKQKITPKTRAIIVQHTFGIPANMPAILQVAREHSIPVIEDCCHSLDSHLDGQRVGTFGVAAFYSFEWGKPIVAGIGGAARVNDPTLFESMLRDYSSLRMPDRTSSWKLQLQYQVHHLLYRPKLYWPLRTMFRKLSKLGAVKGNYNPISDEPAEDFQLQMGPVERQRLENQLSTGPAAFTTHSQRLAEKLNAGLQDVPGISLIHQPDQASTVFARYPLRVQDKPGLLREARRKNIELAEWYATPVHPVPSSHGNRIGFDSESCPEAENRTRELVSLPLHQRVTEQDIDRSIEFLRKAA